MQFNIARLYRDANVLSIWEGTTDMMAHDVLRVMFGKKSKQVMAAMDVWVLSLLSSEGRLKKQGGVVEGWWKRFRATMETTEKEEIEMRSREIMERLADVAMGVLLVVAARRDGDEVAAETAEMRIAEKVGREVNTTRGRRWRGEAARDWRIVFGSEDLGKSKARP
jgi:hypothetical protein